MRQSDRKHKMARAGVPDTLRGDLPSRVDTSLVNDLHRMGLLEAVVEVKSPRFWRYIMDPRSILRHHWNLLQEASGGDSGDRVYVLGQQPSPDTRRFRGVGQRLIINRREGRVTLLTYAYGEVQEIQVDLDSTRVLENRRVA
ncbi:MAG: hypothetical protein AB1758_21985 [Candidatus Eremiobacterota bacterium]